jgi:hypothetical protein
LHNAVLGLACGRRVPAKAQLACGSRGPGDLLSVRRGAGRHNSVEFEMLREILRNGSHVCADGRE